MPKLDSLERVFEADLKDVYDAEKRLTKALPKMIKAAKSEELANALREHLEVTGEQVSRLEQVFEATGLRAVSKPCAAMKGLLEEGEEVMETEGTEPFTDLALICSGRRVEHYEMAAYLSLIAIAEVLHGESVTKLLRKTLSEEQEADQTLAMVARNLMAGLGDASSERASGGERESEMVRVSNGGGRKS